MIYAVPTKKGLGVELWGTREDLEYLYEVISKFWNDENLLHIKGYEDKNKLISSFSYEIRKASYGSRLTRNSSHYSFEEIPYLGFKVSWVHIVFSIAALRYNMRMVESNKGEIAMLEEMRKMIAEQLNCEESEITADTSFKDDLGADSLDLFEMVMAFEEEFNVEIPDEIAEKIKTVKDTVDYIDKNK